MCSYNSASEYFLFMLWLALKLAIGPPRRLPAELPSSSPATTPAPSGAEQRGFFALNLQLEKLEVIGTWVCAGNLGRVRDLGAFCEIEGREGGWDEEEKAGKEENMPLVTT